MEERGCDELQAALLKDAAPPPPPPPPSTVAAGMIRLRNSVTSLRRGFLTRLPEKVSVGVDPEKPYHFITSRVEGLKKGEREYYKRQFDTLRSFEEVDALNEPDSVTEEEQQAELAQSEFAMKISNYANIVLLALKVYATIRSGSIAIAASTLDSLLDLMAGGILWFTHLYMKKVNIYQFPIGKLRVQPVGIIVFAALMATLGDVADDLEETILSKESLERTCEDNSGNGEKGNDGLYSLVSEWLEDSNFSQLFGDLNERSNVETTNIDVEEVEVNERIYCDDEDDENDVDYEYNSSDDCEEFLESDIEINEDDELFESNVDPSVEFKGTAAKEKEKIAIRKYSEIDCINSSNEVSIEGSEEESNAKWPVFNPRSESETSNLVVGMLFSCKEEFKEVVQNCAIVNGKSIKFVKNDKRRCRVVCRKPNCPFLIYISKHQGSHSWQIRSLQEHTCSWSYHNKTLTSTVIAKKFVNKVRINPQCKTKMFKRQVIDELKLHVSNSQARKALIKAHKLVNIKEEEQFGQIWDYCLEIVRTNPGTTISVQTTTDPDLEGKKSFLRMYVCFDACKRGFLAGCRPIVGVDGCFLKGPQGGQLLTAVTLDGNNNIFPIAWAVVESETRNSWEWFLEHLGKDLQIFEEQYRYTFISDKQKGLIPAFENVFPNVTNRFCVRHLHQNFKLAGFQGIALKNVLWAAARSTTVNQFTHNMEQLAKIDANAYKWLNEKHPGEWSRSHFSYISKCDTLLNNMCECFNAMILEARELPIISIFESIRNLVMTRMQEKKAISMKWSDTICPRIREILGRNLYESGNCIGVKSDDNNYQITTMQGAQYTVDLDSSSCSCRRWELTGLPCTHVCAAINMVELDHDNFVSNYYLVDTYRRTYENNIKPVNGHEEWPKSKREPPLPPKYNKPKRGRPRKLRRSGMDQQPKESQRSNLNRSTVVLHCSQCKQIGHNSKTCGKKKNKKSLRNEAHEVQQTTSNDASVLIGELEHQCNSQTASVIDNGTQGSSLNERLLVYTSKRRKVAK